MIDTTKTYNYTIDEWDISSPVFKALNITTEDIEEILSQSALCKVPFEYMLGVYLCGNNGVTVLTNNDNKTLTLPAQAEQTNKPLFDEIIYEFYK